ncbi:MAG: threonine synthase [Verrucomicrobia bacterium]|nr:threonine synthase [Verrucomicrobiota bacterium]MDE3099102.1 threonine synthase [Verrucomicrobiota bacterium]
MAALLFYSTNGQSPPVTLREAFLQGQAPDRGLYLPEKFPALTPAEIAEFPGLPYSELAFRVLSKFTADVVPDDELAAICREAYTFAVPLEKVHDRVHLMRLDQGPTASFKDFAALLMARLMGRFIGQDGRQLTILTATSGDTGAAVAHAFHNVPGIRVIVLFPFAEVAASQRKLMTTLRGNVRTVAIDGKFDDCQAMVKRAFADDALRSIPLSSANSINIGRLLPQSVYYFHAASRVAQAGEPIVFSAPSGNFGDMMGAIVAARMGLPVKKIIAPVNDNDAFPRFLQTGAYKKIVPSRNSLSNAMNVGHPSNLARLMALYGGWMDETGVIHRMPDLAALRRDVFSSSVSDERTRETFIRVWNTHRLLLEPHGAVAWRGFEDWLETETLDGLPAVILETANPAKFPEEIEKCFGWSPDVPPAMAAMIELPEDYDRMKPDYEAFRAYLLENHRSGRRE